MLIRFASSTRESNPWSAGLLMKDRLSRLIAEVDVMISSVEGSRDTKA